MRARADELAQGRAIAAAQARAERAVGADPYAVAAVAEVLGHRADEADEPAHRARPRATRRACGARGPSRGRVGLERDPLRLEPPLHLGSGHRLARPNGMSSMNRAVAPKRHANRARSPTSSSFSPRTTTTLSFTERNRRGTPPRCRRGSARARAARPETPRSFSGSSVSSETLRRETPASRSGARASRARGRSW